MHYRKDSFTSHYHSNVAFLRSYKLPMWEDFPDLELYMDQLLVLVNRYLPYQTGEKGVTASMINNYVKQRLMPPPVKKKYSRVHLAHLIVICTLKDALGMSVIQQMLPPDMEDTQLRTTYNSFVHNQIKACNFVADSTDSVALPLLQEEEHISERINDLVLQIALSASITKSLTERFAAQQDTAEQEDDTSHKSPKQS